MALGAAALLLLLLLLQIADDAESWFEAGPVADVLFAGNTVRRNYTRYDKLQAYILATDLLVLSPSST